MVSRVIAAKGLAGGCVVDVGCGDGAFLKRAADRFDRHVGVDVVRYPSFPDFAEFQKVDLDTATIPVPDNGARLVVSIETIEHVENPRALMRELVRIAAPGGQVIVTTPNQLSFSSLLTLIVKRRFNAFQDVHYPAHITALLEIDLRRMAAEVGLQDVEIAYSLAGRIPLTPRNYPRPLSRLFPTACSDNVLLIGRKVI